MNRLFYHKSLINRKYLACGGLSFTDSADSADIADSADFAYEISGF